MDKQRWNTINEILDKALELDERERAAYIQDSCGQNPDLANMVFSLIEGKQESDTFWKEGIKKSETLLRDYSKSLIQKNSPVTFTPFRIGKYEAIEILGQGGMGTIYKAIRIDGEFERYVAIKVVNEFFVSESVIERFRRERQILARLNHPNIAALYDGGFTDDGRPFLVMELIEGKPITDFCEVKKLTLSERIKLIKTLCKAVHHAHQNLVIHRDLKPSNILVDENGNLKVLDFGIAKLIKENPEADFQKTAGSMKLMSLQYASPEQIKDEAITTATDVYNLGLIAYELLFKNKALDLSGMKRGNAEKVILNETPSVVGKNLPWKIEADLKAIVQKALRKEPEARYEWAGQLLEDFERYEKHLPVRARKGTYRYQISKFYHRHTIGIWTFLLFLFSITGFGIYHYRQVTQERAIAEKEAQTSKEVSDFLIQLFSSADPNATQGREITARELLDEGAARIHQLENQPEIQAELLSTMGLAFSNAGYFETADSLLQQAITLNTELYGPQSTQTASSYNMAGFLYQSSQDFERAVLHFRKSLAIYQRFGSKYEASQAILMLNLGKVFRDTEQIDSAAIYIENGIQLNSELYTSDPGQLITDKATLAYLYRAQEKYIEAEQLYLEVLQHLNKSESPDLTKLTPNQNNLAYLYRVQSKYKEAEMYYREALNNGTKLYGEDHPTVLILMNNLASTLHDQGKLSEAEQILKQRIELSRKRFGDMHWRTGGALYTLAGFYIKGSQRFEEANHILNEVIAIYSTDLGPNHSWTIFARLNKSFCLEALNFPEAQVLFDQTYNELKDIAHRFTLINKDNLHRSSEYFRSIGDEEKANLLLALDSED